MMDVMPILITSEGEESSDEELRTGQKDMSALNYSLG